MLPNDWIHSPVSQVQPITPVDFTKWRLCATPKFTSRHFQDFWMLLVQSGIATAFGKNTESLLRKKRSEGWTGKYSSPRKLRQKGSKHIIRCEIIPRAQHHREYLIQGCPQSPKQRRKLYRVVKIPYLFYPNVRIILPQP